MISGQALFLYLQKLIYRLLNLCHVGSRLEAGNNIALAVDKELCEIPLNITLLVVVGICLVKLSIENF